MFMTGVLYYFLHCASALITLSPDLVTSTSCARPPCRERTCLRDRKLHIKVYKVLRIYVFLKLMHCFKTGVHCGRPSIDVGASGR